MGTKTGVKSLIIIFVLLSHICLAQDKNHQSDNYLLKPSGQYGVGFQDFQWVNELVCPDPYFTGKNRNDFSPNNPNFCHEVIVRIYYPATILNQPATPYYRPIIKEQQTILSEISSIPRAQIEQLNELRSFSVEKAPLITGKRFPVLLFSPGFGCSIELYENFITELVSHGYIVVGINSLFIDPVELRNGHIVNAVEPKSREEIESIFVPLQFKDLIFSYEQIRNLHHSNSLFRAMDLKHIGVFGHSLGARILADASHANPNWFQAAVTLDIGFDLSGASTKKFDIPFMHQISANRKLATIPIEFELGNDGFLVGLSPNESTHNFSYHMNFSDFSTLQYHPALQSYQAYRREHALDGFSLKFMSQEPTQNESDSFDKMTYVFIKKENEWNLIFYQDKEKVTDIDTKLIDGLDAALANLPNKLPEQLSESETASIKNMIIREHRLNFEPTGVGNGWEITYSINRYLLKFFNHYLKQEQEMAFKKCSTLSSNTYMKCGPGTA